VYLEGESDHEVEDTDDLPEERERTLVHFREGRHDLRGGGTATDGHFIVFCLILFFFF